VILCADPRAQYLAHKADIDRAIARVLDKGRYILGDETAAFEREFAEYVGVTDAIGVGSGTDALHVALGAIGVGPGDEVITVSHTAVATVAAIELTGATPVLVDIEPEYFTLDPAALESAITPRTKAIIPVHLYGQSANLDAILAIARPRGIRVIEDCAQAHGARYRDRANGAIGDIGCFSFYPTKNLGAIGDGGMLVTSDPELAERARLLREYGWKERYVSHIAGWNTRLDELQAAVLRVKLAALDADNGRRVAIANAYDQRLADAGIETPARRRDAAHVFHLYVVRSKRRDALQTHLRAHGVHALIHYPVPIHLQPAYRSRLRVVGDALPETERAAAEVLSLPMYPELDSEQQAAVIEGVISFEALEIAASNGSRESKAASPVIHS
jgi:dTDP-4-amino-4,6-dideoxygalactose transaminase